ncbi:hypothetical protein SJR89_01260 [Aeromonas caviae]|uniref:DUF6950 family protein n=1 Tax=Aeromonas caviae TaxID=648 RepID=UPI0029DD9C91|nr:hypothetical protein [Aeromonas caviae]MDX7825733.1 hypothetical protein [Aeromonas caviae]
MDIEENKGNLCDRLINKYRGQERIPSRLCCFTLLLEWVDTPESQNALELISGRFKTVRGAKRVLPELLQHKDLDSLMTANSTEQIDPNFIQDGDLLVVDGYHTLIFHGGGYLFGVVDSGTFDYVDFSSVLSANKDLKAYRKLK